MIIEGDCLQELKKLEDESVDLVLTDPPYGMNFRSNHRKVKHQLIENDNNLSWLPEFVTQTFRVLKNNSHFYCFCSFHNIDKFKVEIEKLFTLKNILIWEKNNTGMGDLKGDYAPKYEMILYAHKGRKELRGRRDSNILKFNRTNNPFHPTQKPLDLMKFLIEKSSNEQDIVLDPFSGSGSTLVAAKETNRNYIGIELSPEYISIINKRIEQVNPTE